jgi:uncharacterized protein (UPF0548 family)
LQSLSDVPRRLIQDPMRPQWRLLRGWSSAELERRLPALRGQPLTSDQALPDGARYHSEAVIAREPPGPPLPDGPFMRARELVRRYDFSDPRIVTGHFDRSADLLGRLMLLEIKVLGLRALCGVVVTDVKERTDHERTVWGFRYDTLASHIQAGSEWFVLAKDHATGEVQFQIEALWRGGQLPSALQRAGFQLLAGRYLRAWHRLAYIRLRARLDARGLPALPRGERLVHVGLPLPAPPVEALAGLLPPPEMELREETVDQPALLPAALAVGGR